MSVFKNNNWSLGGILNLFRGSAKNIVAINCTSKEFNILDNGRTFINNGRVIKNGWTLLDGSNATALSPYVMNGDNGDKYKVKADTGDRQVILDVVALNGVEWTYKIINATHNLVLSTVSNTELIDGAALPYTIVPALWNSYKISSDGTNFYFTK